MKAAEAQFDMFYSVADTDTGEIIASDKPSLDFLISQSINVILDIFLAGHVCVINSSFGKDSSCVVSLAIEAAKRYQAITGKQAPVRIVTSDTLMENPLLISVVRKLSASAVRFGEENNMDVKQYFATPNMLERALVSTIGGRTIFSANGMNSKCQDGLKAAPLKRIRTQVKKEFKGKSIVSLTGVRFSESDARGKKMRDRGEKLGIWENEREGGDLFASPIADWTDGDVFAYLDRAAAEALPYKTYSNFVGLISLYEMTGLEVCSTATASTSDEKGMCSTDKGRFGCISCLRVADDHSMRKALLFHENLRPLYDFNRLIRSGMKVPEHRAWIGRAIDDNGQALLSPVSHSKDWCKTLLKAAISIQADEEEWAYDNLKPMRFSPLITQEELLAIAYQWQRYFGTPWSEAVNIWNELYADPSKRTTKSDMDAIISENETKTQPLSYFGEKRGRIQLIKPNTRSAKHFGKGFLDHTGELAGVYPEGSAVVDKKGNVHSPFALAQSFTVDLGDEPDLAWFWISEIASEGNRDVSFLLRDGYISLLSGNQTSMAKSFEYMWALVENGLVDIANDIDAITQRDDVVPPISKLPDQTVDLEDLIAMTDISEVEEDAAMEVLLT